MADKKQKTEGTLVRGFLSELRPDCVIVTTGDKPDAVAKVGDTDVAIELTTYNLDSSPGKSAQGREILSFWSKVQKEIRTRAKRHPELEHVAGKVTLKWGPGGTGVRPNDLADSLVSFAKANARSLAPGGNKEFRQFGSTWPSLDKAIEYLRLTHAGTVRWLTWECTDTGVGWPGLNQERLAEIIEDKNTKAPGYKWPEGAQRWLLICAPGHPISSSGAGPGTDLGVLETCLKQACAASPFDAICFWERLWESRHWLKGNPPEPTTSS